ncbi:MAG: sarcosine oxidase subunit alpha family protein [Rhizobiaceae bacterium]
MATTQTHRLAEGGIVDRMKPLSFTFDGATHTGYVGDTLASALIANGVRLVGRSFKYHRPRGILTAGSEEPNALAELRSGARREANSRMTTTELYDGLEAASQNRWPSLKRDLLAINQLGAPFFVAGFYYKTFMWPARFWEAVYEPMIRRAAGLGDTAKLPDPDHYEKAWAHCDVLVAGAGPAGISAALAAGRAGARVILAEEDFIAGGRLLSDDAVIGGMSGAEWLAGALAELAAMDNVRLMLRSAVFGAYDGGTYGVVERVNDHMPTPPAHEPRQRLWRVVAKRCIVAMGAIERPVAFANNDRPGVMMASAARTYLGRFGAVPGRRIALFTNNSDGWKTVDAALNAGIEIAAVIDARDELPTEYLARGRAGGFRVLHGVVGDVTGGRGGISKAKVALKDGGTAVVEADCLAVSGGWNPAVGLTCNQRGRPVWRDDIAAFVPGDCPAGMTVAGAANGDFSLSDCLAGGHEAGVEAAGATGHARKAGQAARAGTDTYALTALWHVSGKGKAFVDQQNDVTVADIRLADTEGFSSVEHLKRYTTLGMATDQGKTSNVNGLAIMAGISGRTISETGTTIYRPPYVPVAIGTFAGHHRGENFQPVRLTPSHRWAAARGAAFVDVGAWKRAQWYPLPGEKTWLESVNREVLAVRNGVGFCDVSTLGKIDVMGPDAGAFLDRVYINTFSTLAVGKARYGLMLREDGLVMDDGTTARLAEDHYFMTTTTANAALVMQHLEFCRQVLWPELDVQLASATDQWAQFSIAGPKTREVLRDILDPSEDISNEAFPFMGAGEVHLRGADFTARLFRISFSGELAFEISVPRGFGEALAENLMRVGGPLGITPYGTEALGVMRLEKGHAAGAELNGTTTAGDLGLGRMMSAKKDYIGRVMAGREALIDPGRQVLVGLKPVAKSGRLFSGGHVFAKGAQPGPDTDDGYVTSVGFSPVFGQYLGLGLVARGRERIGEIVTVRDPLRNTACDCEIAGPAFYDPDGGRQRG